MAKKKSSKETVKVIVEKAMPGWTISDRITGAAKRSTLVPDAVSPSLAKMKAKAAGTSEKSVKFSVFGKHQGYFVNVKPARATDKDGDQEKVVLVRDGKIVAQQG